MKYTPAKLHEKNGDLKQRWCVEYYFEHPETLQLTRFTVWISSKLKTRGERRRKGDALVSEINKKLKSGWNPFENNLHINTKLSDAFDQVLFNRKFNTRPRTYTDYKCALSSFIDYLRVIGKPYLTPAEINHAMALNYIDWIRKKYKLTNRTINNRLVYLKASFNILIEREYCEYNPFLKIKKLEIEHPGILAFTENETKLISQTLPYYNKELYVISLLIYYCFIRPQEICRLRIYNFDMKHREIVIHSNQSKNKKQEVVGIPEVLYNQLIGLDLGKYPNDYYFCSKEFKPGTVQIAPTRIAEAWRIYADGVALPKEKKLYHLKHTGVGRAVDKGINLRDIQLQIRHSSLEITDKYLRQFRTRVSSDFLNKMPGL